MSKSEESITKQVPEESKTQEQEMNKTNTLYNLIRPSSKALKILDNEVFSIIETEKSRQRHQIDLIASENITYPAVMEAVGSVMTNKYAEGYPGARYYGGCENVDKMEQLAINRAKLLFGADHANVQPHSGTQANFAVYTAVLKPGDKILTMQLEHGGHLSHGFSKNLSGMLYKVVNYGVNLQTGFIDYEQLEEVAMKEKPTLITVGASAYPRIIDFKRMGEIARKSGSLLMADIAHIAGLVATGLHPSPIPHADFVTTTTHKTLRGPRGGLVLCKAKYAKILDSALFPGTQGGPLENVIAGKAVCFGEALKPEFMQYQQQIILNTKTLCEQMKQFGHKIVSDGTDNHLFLVDLRVKYPNMTGKQAQILLEKANIVVNKNTIPGETRSPFQASGIRIGGPTVTSRGMLETEMKKIGDLIHRVLESSNLKDKDQQEQVLDEVRKEVEELCIKFKIDFEPQPQGLLNP